MNYMTRFKIIFLFCFMGITAPTVASEETSWARRVWTVMTSDSSLPYWVRAGTIAIKGIEDAEYSTDFAKTEEGHFYPLRELLKLQIESENAEGHYDVIHRHYCDESENRRHWLAAELNSKRKKFEDADLRYQRAWRISENRIAAEQQYKAMRRNEAVQRKLEQAQRACQNSSLLKPQGKYTLQGLLNSSLFDSAQKEIFQQESYKPCANALLAYRASKLKSNDVMHASTNNNK